MEKHPFAAKLNHYLIEEQYPESFYEKAAICEEFIKIVCISLSFINLIISQCELWSNSYYGLEKDLFIAFKPLMEAREIINS